LNLSSLFQPKYILEIGTFTGFSAICLTKGLQTNGELHTIELREDDANTVVEKIFYQPVWAIKYIYTQAMGEIIKQLPRRNGTLFFIDADKTSYITYYEEASQRLSGVVFILADNVLFHGQVLEEKN